MSKFTIGSAALIGICFLAVFSAQAKYIWPWERMSPKKVCKRWGETPLNAEKFKNAENNQPLRAGMACSILKNQEQYIGKSPLQIREIFGAPDGYYVSEIFAAYLIGAADRRGLDSWQILFLLDVRDRVSEIVVHKTCC